MHVHLYLYMTSVIKIHTIYRSHRPRAGMRLRPALPGHALPELRIDGVARFPSKCQRIDMYQTPLWNCQNPRPLRLPQHSTRGDDKHFAIIRGRLDRRELTDELETVGSAINAVPVTLLGSFLAEGIHVAGQIVPRRQSGIAQRARRSSRCMSESCASRSASARRRKRRSCARPADNRAPACAL